MFKNMIAPVQAWLLSQGRCVGCGMPIGKSKAIRQSRSSDFQSRQSQNSKVEELITCKCGRVYVKENNKYRRALLSEV